MGVNIGVACRRVVSVTKRLGSQEFDPPGSALIDCASAITLVESSVIALPPLPFFRILSCISRDQLSAPWPAAEPSFRARRQRSGLPLYTVDEEDADARHLLGPLLDDLGDGGPSTNRRG